MQQKLSWKAFVLQTTVDFTSRVSKSYVPFRCKFPMVMYFVPILHKRCRSKTNFYVLSYDKTSLKFCASFRFLIAVFMEKFPKICYLNYVRRGIVLNSSCTVIFSDNVTLEIVEIWFHIRKWILAKPDLAPVNFQVFILYAYKFK